MIKRKVFVTNKSAHDYSDAERFGELLYITDGHVDRFNTSHMARVIKKALENSSPEDYIIITSLTIICSICCSLFVHKHGTLNLLLYKNGKYIERTHDFKSFMKDDSLIGD